MISNIIIYANATNNNNKVTNNPHATTDDAHTTNNTTTTANNDYTNATEQQQQSHDLGVRIHTSGGAEEEMNKTGGAYGVYPPTDYHNHLNLEYNNRNHNNFAQEQGYQQFASIPQQQDQLFAQQTLSQQQFQQPQQFQQQFQKPQHFSNHN